MPPVETGALDAPKGLGADTGALDAPNGEGVVALLVPNGIEAGAFVGALVLPNGDGAVALELPNGLAMVAGALLVPNGDGAAALEEPNGLDMDEAGAGVLDAPKGDGAGVLPKGFDELAGIPRKGDGKGALLPKGLPDVNVLAVEPKALVLVLACG